MGVKNMALQYPSPLSRFLRMAVVTGVERAVQIHIDRGDDLNARDDTGQTPLMLSAARNKAAICKLLLDAGADAGLLDPSGRDALGIAYAAGATDAASAIETACMHKWVVSEDDAARQLAQAANEASASNISKPEPTSQIPTRNAEGTACGIASVTVDYLEEYDFGSWEAEEDQIPPEDDSTIAATNVVIQAKITEHQPIDTSADWDDFEAFLPDRAMPLPRDDDAEARERLRLILLRAIREGSVPHTAIEDLTRANDGEPNLEAETLLTMIINDLGAETDDRIEYSAPHESFNVFVVSEAKSAEMDTIADALAFMDNLAARRSEPLRIYQREPLLTAEAEVALGQAMERGIETALDALAAWPTGIGATLEEARLVANGTKSLRAMSSGQQVEPQEAGAVGEANVEIDAGVDYDLKLAATDSEPSSAEEVANPQFSLDAKAATDELAKFCITAELLSGISVNANRDAPEWKACRGALDSLCLTRGFLMELADSGLDGEPDSAAAFSQAIGTYRSARDRMVVANLKLVYSIAKKYLFSGQPLDDLVQEGNIGLIKAVDRYDWRKGFKFSTYATWWIRQQVGRFVADKGKTIRIPLHVYEKIQRLAQAAHAFELRHGYAPTIEEISARVELPSQKVEALFRLGLDPLAINELHDIDSLIAVHATDQFAGRDPMECVEEIQLGESIDCFLSTLKLKEEIIVRMRYGIGVKDSMTLEEIGARLDVTRERIRQIEAKALRRLRQPTRLTRFLAELGLTATPSPSSEASVDSDVEADDDEAPEAKRAVMTKPKPAVPVPVSEHRGARVKPTALDKLLVHAREVGIVVEDYIEGDSRRLWVHITNTPDNRSRKIVRKLIDLGFEFWPGKGYWR